jgi:hypothetical protein
LHVMDHTSHTSQRGRRTSWSIATSRAGHPY